MTPRRLATGLATSTGSLPHRDPVEAAAFVLRLHPGLPSAPSLPRRTPLEGMVAQAAAGIQGVVVRPDGTLAVDPRRLDPAAPVAPGLDGPGFGGLRAFLRAVAGRTAPVKVQLTGPVTLGTALMAAGAPGERAYHVAAAAVRVRASAVLAAVRAAAPGATLVAVLDEPGLVAAFRHDFPLTTEHTIDAVSSALATLEPHAVTGVHCCGPTDWAAVLAAGPDLVSAPVAAGLPEAAHAVVPFLERGGVVAWGTVPTDRPLGTGPELLWRRLTSDWHDLVRGGCDPRLLRRQAIVTPVCGLALHTVPQARAVLELTAALAHRLEDQPAPDRFRVGA